MMARSRILKPEFWSDEKLALVPREARLTFAGLWTCSDDYGVTKGHPAWLKAQIFPYDVDLTVAEFRKWLADLERIGVIDPFHGGRRILLLYPKLRRSPEGGPAEQDAQSALSSRHPRETLASVSRATRHRLARVQR